MTEDLSTVVEAIDGDYRVMREVAVDAAMRDPEVLLGLADRLRERLKAGDRAAGQVEIQGMGAAFGRRFTLDDRFLPKVALAVWLLDGDDLQHPAFAAYRALYGDVAARAVGAAELGLWPEHAGWSLPILATALDDPSPNVVGAAVTSLGVLARNPDVRLPDEIVGRLRELAASSDPGVAARARAVLDTR